MSWTTVWADVRTADSAEAALNLLAAWQPALVISDVRMPGMVGLELLRLLGERVADVDEVLMTAYYDLDTAAEAMRRGAADILVKPLDLRPVRAVVERRLADRSDRRRAGTRRTCPVLPRRQTTPPSTSSDTVRRWWRASS